MNLRLTNILNEYSTGIVNKLKQKFKQENSALTDEIIEEYINRFDQVKSSPKVDEKDITKYSFQKLEQVVDSFPTKEKVKKQEDGNTVEFSQTELIYNKAPLQIYHGSNERTCIKIKGDFPASWCIARSRGGNMYNGYRYAGTEPSFYFVKNLERLNKIEEIVDDEYCFFVVQYNNQGNYIVTSAKNNGDRTMSWDDILKIEPLLQGTESLFKNVPLTDEEKEYYRRFKNGISDEEYKDLSYKEKKIYISISRYLTNKQLEITPIDLINDYITKGVSLTPEQFDFIKDKRQLFNNYRRVTIDNVIPEYLKGNIEFQDRWLVLTDEEAIDLYKETIKNTSTPLESILLYKPSLIKYFQDTLYKLNIFNIRDILTKQPSLIKYFDDRFDELSNQIVIYILTKQPSLINYFEDRFYEDYEIASMLTKQPSLIEYFEDRLDNFNSIEIKNILKKQPKLKRYFKKQGLVKESLKYLSLRNILKKQKFENHKRYSI
jgi:hypothetical protein